MKALITSVDHFKDNFKLPVPYYRRKERKEEWAAAGSNHIVARRFYDLPAFVRESLNLLRLC